VDLPLPMLGSTREAAYKHRKRVVLKQRQVEESDFGFRALSPGKSGRRAEEQGLGSRKGGRGSSEQLPGTSCSHSRSRPEGEERPWGRHEALHRVRPQ
jgi:hypothetical protein